MINITPMDPAEGIKAVQTTESPDKRMELTIAFGARSLSSDRYAPAVWTHGGVRVC